MEISNKEFIEDITSVIDKYSIDGVFQGTYINRLVEDIVKTCVGKGYIKVYSNGRLTPAIISIFRDTISTKEFIYKLHICIYQNENNLKTDNEPILDIEIYIVADSFILEKKYMCDYKYIKNNKIQYNQSNENYNTNKVIDKNEYGKFKTIVNMFDDCEENISIVEFKKIVENVWNSISSICTEFNVTFENKSKNLSAKIFLKFEDKNRKCQYERTMYFNK